MNRFVIFLITWVLAMSVSHYNQAQEEERDKDPEIARDIFEIPRKFLEDNFYIPQRGDVSGTWYNELGSTMKLTQREGGVLDGVYCNRAKGSEPVKEKLVGIMGKGVPATVGFVVNYRDAKSTASWSGEYFKEAGVDKKEVILTTWILTANLQDFEEYWKSTRVGQNRFTREPQNGAEVPCD